MRPLTGRDASSSVQATPQIQRPLAVAAGFHRAMAAATGNQVSGRRFEQAPPYSLPLAHPVGMGLPVERRVVNGLPVLVLLCEASFGGFGSDYKSVAVADQSPLFAAAIPRQA